MKQVDAIHKLTAYERQQRYVFTTSDLAKIFHHDSKRALHAGLRRLTASGVLVRACQGVYVNGIARNRPLDLLEQIACAMRRGEYSYVSLESALAEYGVISQVPVDRLTIMTTGREGEYPTPFGTIEFTHTKRSVPAILERCVDSGRALRLATEAAAIADLRRVGRNQHLLLEHVS